MLHKSLGNLYDMVFVLQVFVNQCTEDNFEEEMIEIWYQVKSTFFNGPILQIVLGSIIYIQVSNI